MCGRFSLTKEELEIEKRFNAKFYSNDLMKRYNVAPSQLSLVITNEKPGELQLFKWGLIPSWAKDPKIGFMMINAKSETVFEKPAFKSLIRKRRCLVISDGFYEWKVMSAKKKQPFRIGMQDDKLFAFAGLWDAWTDKDSGEIVPTFTILTTDANELVAPIHNRMPVLLRPENESDWLNQKTEDSSLLALLKPFPEAQMKVYPVSELVNSPRNDSPQLILPLEGDDKSGSGQQELAF